MGRPEFGTGDVHYYALLSLAHGGDNGFHSAEGTEEVCLHLVASCLDSGSMVRASNTLFKQGNQYSIDSNGPPVAYPALLTKTSMVPYLATASLKRISRSEDAISRGIHMPPSFEISDTSEGVWDGFREEAMHLCPNARIARASSRPRPEEHPVTSHCIIVFVFCI